MRSVGRMRLRCCGSGARSAARHGLIEESQPDAALLDINLGETLSFPLARVLRRVASGSSFQPDMTRDAVFPPSFARCAAFPSPSTITDLTEVLEVWDGSPPHDFFSSRRWAQGLWERPIVDPNHRDRGCECCVSSGTLGFTCQIAMPSSSRHWTEGAASGLPGPPFRPDGAGLHLPGDPSRTIDRFQSVRKSVGGSSGSNGTPAGFVGASITNPW